MIFEQLAIGLGVNVALGLITRWARVMRSGAWIGVVLGTTIWMTVGWRGWLLLVTFFVAGSPATRIGFGRKTEMGAAQEAGGTRGTKEALANGLVAFASAILFATTGSDVFLWAFMGAAAAGLADTAASEVGPLLATGARHPYLFRPMKHGEEGAISLGGTLAGALGATLVAGVGVLVGFLPPAAIWIGMAAGAGASWLESVAGSLLAGREGRYTNEVLNFCETAAGAMIAAALAIVTGYTA